MKLRALLAIGLLAGCSGKSGGPEGGPLPHYDGGGNPNPGVDGGGNPDPGVDGGNNNAFTAYCGRSDSSSECVCGADPNASYTAGAHCGPSDVGSPSLCCATAAWPGRTANNTFDVECVCSQIFCVESSLGDFCSCGFAQASQGDKPVSSCSGASCCRSRSTIAPICSCYAQNVPCSDGDEPVPSCGTSDVQCDVKTVSACN